MRYDQASVFVFSCCYGERGGEINLKSEWEKNVHPWLLARCQYIIRY
jgi:hypothetical protein